MNGLRSACVLLLVLPSLGFADDLHRGLQAIQRKDYDLAITSFTAYLRDHPDSVEALRSRANAYFFKADYDKAIRDLDTAIRLDPKLIPVYRDRGILYVLKGEYDKALKDFDEGIRLDPKSADAYANRGAAYGAKKDYDKALKDFNEAIRLDPKSAEGYANRGAVYIAKKDYDKAIRDCDTALRHDPKYVRALCTRAQAHGGRKDYEKALRDFESALRLKPDNPGCYNDLAWLLATCPQDRIRDGKKAVRYATKACKLRDWKDPTTLDTLAAAYAEAGDFKAAVKWQKKVLEIGIKDKGDMEKARKRLKFYQEGKPYRRN